MPRIDNDKFYTSSIKNFGISAKGLNWNSKSSQELRFDMILELLPDDLSPYHIVDAGCGFGDFYLYTKKRKKIFKKYTGIEVHTEVFSIVSNRLDAEIVLADVCKDDIPDADFYICSGAMNILDSFETHLFMQKCFSASKYGFIFNILHGDIQSKTYNYLSTKKIKSIASDMKVGKMVLKSGYMKNDITVCFYKSI